jgi:hypothetical protein
MPPGSLVDLRLSVDQKTIREILAYGPAMMGRVVGRAGKDGITLRDKEGEKRFVVARDARVLLDDKTSGKLTDLIDGTVAQLRLSADQATVREVRAEGPSFRGTVKGFDPAKNHIILTIGAKDGMGGEDKEFELTKETAVLTEISGVPVKLTDLGTAKEVILRLSIDQKAASRITVLGQ